MFIRIRQIIVIHFLILLLMGQGNVKSAYGQEDDFIIEGTCYASVDLPRILFLLKRDFNGPPLEYEGYFEVNWAFLDTGASGIVMSRETRDAMNLTVEPAAQFVDYGVGGAQTFEVSEPLYLGVADYFTSDPYDTSAYEVIDSQWRYQMTQNYVGFLEQPLDILGIPVMAGKTVILNSMATNDLDYFGAEIKESNNPAIPTVDFQIPLRFERYIHYADSLNIPPEPVLAYNPVIDNVSIHHAGMTCRGTWLLDTGAMLSIVSVEQGVILGLTDEYGDPLVEPDFWAAVGGVGGSVDIPGFFLDQISIPTLSGFNLIYTNVGLAVHDIGVYDEVNDRYIILDGIFGSNFLAASWNPPDLFEIAGTPFDWIVIDMQKGLLGFDVNPIYPVPTAVPTCGDLNHPWNQSDFNRNCLINFGDFTLLGHEWNNSCDGMNWNCRGADLDFNGLVNLTDLAIFIQAWLNKSY